MTPDKISHFEIRETLGAGGMGVVYKAYDTKLNRFVAVKALSRHIAHNPEFRKRFLIEAQAVAALNHPNIATIFETREEGDDAYIVMEFIEGEELSKKTSKGKLGIPESLDYAIQIAEGLKEAHSKGIVHRDIKSANIMVTGSNLVKIMDFGLAKLVGQSMMTQLGATVGTINYMSPEQTRGGEIDQRTDLWALGVVFYEMLTGKLPFKADYEQGIIYSILNEEPKPVSEIVKDIPKEIDEVIKNLLSKLPENRYQAADEVLTDLKAIKQSVETGIPVAQLKSGTGTAEYINKLRIEKNVSTAFSRKRVIALFAATVILFFTILFKGSDIFKFFSGALLPDEIHLAVLPFDNIGNDSTNRVFCDGLVETLTSQLSQFEQFDGKLWVVPSSEIRKAKIASADEAFNKFATNLALNGSVQKMTQGYRLTLNLVDAGNKRQIASRTIDDPMTSTSFLQDEAIIKVADMLNVELKPKSLELLTAGKTGSAEAYELYLKGRGYLADYDKTKNVDDAIELFNRAVKVDSLFALAYAGLGKAQLDKYQKTKDISFIESSINNCNKAIELNNKLTSVSITLGSIYLETGKNNEAKEEFQKVLEIDPVNSEAYQGRASAFTALGMTREAESSYKKAIEMKPGYWSLYGHLGWFYYQQGRYRDAAAQFQEVVTLTPNNAEGYNNLGTMDYFLDLKDETIKMYKKSLEIEPDYATYSNLAVIYFKEKKYKDAARMYEKVVELNNNDYRIWGYLAASYYWAPGERDKSFEANKHALSLAELQLKINPKDADIITSMASYYAMLGELNKSKSMLTELRFLEITNTQTYCFVGIIYEEWFGDREAALAWIKRALEKGYPVTEINDTPQLQNLIKDKRFIDLVAEVKNTANHLN
jgi:eukaryotic-like serine/threonine-protein kinase